MPVQTLTPRPPLPSDNDIIGRERGRKIFLKFGNGMHFMQIIIRIVFEIPFLLPFSHPLSIYQMGEGAGDEGLVSAFHHFEYLLLFILHP